MSISSAFDGGNIELVDVGETVRLRIKPDVFTELEKKAHMQYFSFRAWCPTQKAVKYEILNAGESSFPEAWPESTVCFSEDGGVSWKRNLSTDFDKAKGVLSWTHSHDQKPVHFSYFPPYSYERNLELVSKCAAVDGVQVKTLGLSLEGREISCVTVGKGSINCWIIHRQHPGETQVLAKLRLLVI